MYRLIFASCTAALLLLAAACNISKPAVTNNTPTSDYTVTVLEADLPSPRKEMTGQIGAADVTVNYGSPSVKGRTLAGNLIPYGMVWRAGANEATTLEVSEAVTFGGKDLPAGRYALFIRARSTGPWEVILNAEANQWGAYNYDAAKDVLVTTVTPLTVDAVSETMEFLIEGNELVLRWGKIRLPITIQA
jgi:hypothetical protein